MFIKKYLDYDKGITSVVITAPHAGTLEPEEIPHRTYGTYVHDSYSDDIAEFIVKNSIESPYHIISRIHRNRIDLNRNITEGAQGNKNAESIWNFWHKTLDYYCRDASKYGKVLYVDIHSHNNSNEFQLGYGINKEEYLKIYNDRLDPRYDIMFGPYSVKFSLEKSGFKVYTPKENEQYFDGGYDIIKHKSDEVMALQIEIPVAVAKNNIEEVSEGIINSIETLGRRINAISN